MDKQFGEPLTEAQSTSVKVSLPNILSIYWFMFVPRVRNINLFGSYKNTNLPNKGNAIDVAVTYQSGGNFTYEELLYNLVTSPLQVGITRVSSSTLEQVTQPLYLLENMGVGKFNGKTKTPLIFPSQFQNNISYLQEPYVVNGFTQLTYQQKVNNVLIYFYSNKNLNLSRAFSNEKVIQSYGAPQMSLENQINI